MMKQKLFAAVCAAVLAVCPLAGCGETGSSQDVNITEEQLPYGSTISEDFSRDITAAYDTRFLDQGVVDKIVGYYDAIQKKDGDAFKSVVFPLYHDYQMQTIYEGKLTEQQIVEATYDAIKENFGYDFEFSYLDINGFVSKDGFSGERDTLIQLLDDLAVQNGDQKISENTQAFYELTITRYTAKQGSGERHETADLLANEKLYAIQYQNEWYIMYS